MTELTVNPHLTVAPRNACRSRRERLVKALESWKTSTDDRTPMGRETRTADQLRAMVQLRLDALPEAIELRARRPDLAPVVGPVERTGVDAQGRNWDVRSVSHSVGLVGQFRAIVDQVRDRFALAE